MCVARAQKQPIVAADWLQMLGLLSLVLSKSADWHVALL